MTIFQAIILGFVQGLTEFLPVSSSGHLLLMPRFLGWPDQGLAFDAMIHLGTALAALVFYRQDCLNILASVFSRTPDAEAVRMRNAIIVGTIPAVILGLLFRDFFDTQARSVLLVAINLIVWALIMLLAEAMARRASQMTTQAPTPRSAFFIGCAQAMALLPGTSRSGATIASAIFTGQDRASAVRFSFLLGLPLIVAISLLSLIELVSSSAAQNLSLAPLIAGLLTSFAGGLIAIRVLLKLLAHRGLTIFAVYRIGLAIVILLFLR